MRRPNWPKSSEPHLDWALALPKEVAERLGVHVESVKNCERGASSPTTRQIPKIIEFLGYDPEPASKTEPEPIAQALRRLGLTQKSLAKKLGVDPVTVYRWEKGFSVPATRALQRLHKLLQEKPGVTPR